MLKNKNYQHFSLSVFLELQGEAAFPSKSWGVGTLLMSLVNLIYITKKYHLHPDSKVLRNEEQGLDSLKELKPMMQKPNNWVNFY